MHARFAVIAERVERAIGTPWAFMLASLVVIVWFVCGFFVGFANTLYQLLINTGTTIVTFLMVFLIQNTATRNTNALHAKLDELIRAADKASNRLIGVEKEIDTDKL